MADYTARYKNPTPVIVMMTAMLAIGYSGDFGMISDNKEIARDRQYAALQAQKVPSPEETKAEQVIALYGAEGEEWYGKGCGQHKCKGVR